MNELTSEQEKYLEISIREITKETMEVSDYSLSNPFDFDIITEMLNKLEIKQANFDNLIKSINRDNKINEILDDDIRENEI